MNLVLSPDGPLDVGATLARYHIWGEDPVNRLGAGVFRRVLRREGALVPYEVRASGPVDDARLHVRIPGTRSTRVGDAVTGEVRKIFGLDFDLAGFYRMAKGDPILADLVPPLYGLRPTLAPGGLEMLVGSIIAQQVNLTFAFTLRARLVRHYGTPVELGGPTVYAFPQAEVLARLHVRHLRAMQFSTRKAEYIRDVARAVVMGALDFAALAAAPNIEVIERLTSLRGLGRWTADWYLARCVGRGDVCPAGDLAVRKAVDHYYGRGRTLSEEAVRRRASAWGPYQTLAIHYLLAGMRVGRSAAGGGSA
jgi:DNA-3-methyladenine glycosylase II